MRENEQVRTDSDTRQLLQIALSEAVEQPGGNFNKAIGDLANAGKSSVRVAVYDLGTDKVILR